MVDVMALITRPPGLTDLGPRPFTSRTATEVGLDSRQLSQLVRDRVLRRMVKGVYVLATTPDDLQLRLEALELVVPPDTVVCDRHAAWLLGAEMVLAPGEHLESQPLRALRRRGEATLRNGLVDRGQRDLEDADIMAVGGLAVTTPLRTCADLGMVRWPSTALAGMNSVYRTGLVDKSDLLHAVPRFAGRRWVTTLRAVAPLVHGLCESPPEDVLWLRCLEAGIELTPQLTVHDEDGCFIGRFDLGEEQLRLLVEYDGAEWHTTPDQQRHDRTRRRRAESAGWTVVVLTAADLFAQTLKAEELIRAGLRRARTRPGIVADRRRAG